ncbi:DUF2634 domain-containing protein [Neobacillus niacini]|uniref:DUF2634 domain-containing protein n=1 Tax=Neobacillus niacini TaxID=86668 RepID=UPI002865B884|nr:DUF2634 domain-containing protein [Neobacillus niacini]MDR7001554.1 hypothetical protein [Neobacillus niacini]
MALTPENIDETVDPETVVDEEVVPSKTWAIDFENGVIGGFIDDDEATKQFALKSLMTERSKYAIYSDDYGTELMDLIGEDATQALLESEIPRMVEETLIYDDRIDSVSDVILTRDGDKLYISFQLVTVTGEEITTEEVAINGV